jgi:hypothetical protein
MHSGRHLERQYGGAAIDPQEPASHSFSDSAYGLQNPGVSDSQNRWFL